MTLTKRDIEFLKNPSRERSDYINCNSPLMMALIDRLSALERVREASEAARHMNTDEAIAILDDALSACPPMED